MLHGWRRNNYKNTVRETTAGRINEKCSTGGGIMRTENSPKTWAGRKNKSTSTGQYDGRGKVTGRSNNPQREFQDGEAGRDDSTASAVGGSLFTVAVQTSSRCAG